MAEGVSKQNSHPFKVMQIRQSCGFCMVSCISHMHPTPIKAIGCVDRCDRAFMLKTSAAVN